MADKMLDKAAILTKAILKENNTSAEANALLSTVYGLKIALSPAKAMVLGGKSGSLAEKGVELDAESAFTNYVMGNNLYRTPSLFGGDVKKGLVCLEKSKKLYETAGTTQSWEYLSLMALLGQVYHDQKQYDKAITTYKTALKIAPNFSYIKTGLLPLSEKAKGA